MAFAVFIEAELIREALILKEVIDAFESLGPIEKLIHVQPRMTGMKELLHDLETAQKELKKEIRAGMRHVVEPARQEAEQLATRRLPKAGAWAAMRSGVSVKSAYVVPVKRAVRTVSMKRPNFAGLLMDRAMAPALKNSEPEVYKRLEQLVADILRKHRLL